MGKIFSTLGGSDPWHKILEKLDFRLGQQFTTYMNQDPPPAWDRWKLPGNYPVFAVVVVIYHYVERIWRILLTPNFLYNIRDHENMLSR